MQLDLTRKTILLSLALVLVGSCVISWRPPPAVGGAEPSFIVSPQDTAIARRAATEIFMGTGAVIDTFALAENSTLRLVLARGSYIDRPRYTSKGCAHGSPPQPAIQRLAVIAYQLFGRDHGVARVGVVIPRDSAVTGGWFWRESCGTGPNESYYHQPELDSMLARPSAG